MQTRTLNNGAKIPAIGFGTSRLFRREGRQAIIEALGAGYRLIDTARMYMNERTVGLAIIESGVPREEIFVTTKLWKRQQGYRMAHLSFTQSLRRLQMDYVDLYLIHWPDGNRKASWRALTEIYHSGRAKAIGVSNYSIRHLTELMNDSSIVPAVNQIEFNPYLYKEQIALINFCKANGIIVEAYRPLIKGKGTDDDTIKRIAEHHDKTPAQILLRWAIEHGTVPIPKSKNPKRLKENLAVFDFSLSPSEIKQINALSNGMRTLRNPDDIA